MVGHLNQAFRIGLFLIVACLDGGFSCLSEWAWERWSFSKSLVALHLILVALPLTHSPKQIKLLATEAPIIDHTSLEASKMVAICDLSPHSAKKVRVNAWSRIGDRMPKNLFWLFPPRIIPVSTSCVIASVSFSNYKKISTFEVVFSSGLPQKNGNQNS